MAYVNMVGFPIRERHSNIFHLCVFFSTRVLIDLIQKLFHQINDDNTCYIFIEGFFDIPNSVVIEKKKKHIYLHFDPNRRKSRAKKISKNPSVKTLSSLNLQNNFNLKYIRRIVS